MEVGTRKKTSIWTRTGWVAVPVKVLYLVNVRWNKVRYMDEINGNYYRRSSSLKAVFWADTRWE